MNRRGFFKMFATAMAGFTILPPATTYDRIWKAQRLVKVVPLDYFFDPLHYTGEWRWICIPNNH